MYNRDPFEFSKIDFSQINYNEIDIDEEIMDDNLNKLLKDNLNLMRLSDLLERIEVLKERINIIDHFKPSSEFEEVSMTTLLKEQEFQLKFLTEMVEKVSYNVIVSLA